MNDDDPPVRHGPTASDSDGRSASHMAATPMFYADTIVDIQFGVFTSKLILGIEGVNQTVARTAVVVLPTGPLVHAAIQILAQTSSEGFQEFMRERFEEASRLMKDSGQQRSANMAGVPTTERPKPGR